MFGFLPAATARLADAERVRAKNAIETREERIEESPSIEIRTPE